MKPMIPFLKVPSLALVPFLTLVQEKRVLTLSKGINQVDFSWQQVSIDPAAIILIPLADDADTRLLSISYPPGENALIGEVHSSRDQTVTMVISYLLNGIDHLVVHEAVADAGDTRMDLTSFLVLRNFSGETFDPALIFPDQGLSGQVNGIIAISRQGETKRIMMSEKKGIPLVKHYTWDARSMVHATEPGGPTPAIPTGYRIENTGETNLGKSAIPAGKTRVFRKTQADSTIFSGETRLPHVAVGETAELTIGETRDILVTRQVMESRKTNIQKNKKGRVQVWDELRHHRLTLENFKDETVSLTLVDTIPGQWVPVDMGHPYELRDHQTLEFKIQLAAGEKKTISLEYLVKNLFADRFSRYNHF